VPRLARAQRLGRKGTVHTSGTETGALHEMITRPADLAGFRFEEGLVQRILDDTGTEPGALALMAYTLSELWEATKGSTRVLTHEAYDSLTR